MKMRIKYALASCTPNMYNICGHNPVVAEYMAEGFETVVLQDIRLCQRLYYKIEGNRLWKEE